MMEGYNELTKKLIAEGHTADKHPNYVRLPKSFGNDTLNNWYGGFEYERWWIYDQVFKTPCGLQCKGLSCMTGLSYMGINHTYENDNPLIKCPYDKSECEFQDVNLKDIPLKNKCAVHLVNEEYKYEGSVEGIEKIHDDEIRREKISFIMHKNGRVCQNHMHYDREKAEWEMHYDPSICATMKCFGECKILGKVLDKKKGNVYYDIKTSGRRYDLDGTLFEGQRYTNVTKGIRYFDSPVSMDICNVFVNMCKDEVVSKVMNKYHSELFFADHYGKDFSVEVLNIRAESKPSRDLMQDLQDIQSGISVTHESDNNKLTKEKRKEKRKEANDNKIIKLEEKIIKVGYWNMDPHSLDRVRADKWLGSLRIDELEEIRSQKIKEEQEKPVQLSLFE